MNESQNTYRPLLADEIIILSAQGCRAENWNNIQVKDGFNAKRIFNVTFSGNIRIGALNEDINATTPCGLSNASLCNVTIGDNCHIGQVHNRIQEAKIGNKCVIRNVAEISCAHDCTFGNGVEAVVLNEGGGREVPLCSILTSQVAYLTAVYRYRPNLTEALTKMIQNYSWAQASNTCTIGDNVSIGNCGTIHGVNIGDHAQLDGCSKLENGTICSAADAPTYVGTNVIARDFIFAKGSKVTDGALIERSFIGEGTQMGKQYSSTDSLFFCNSQAFHGEACSAFGGPYSVSHHKGSLLIAGLFSFMNVGSSSNQSNHLYKLGPNHQGVLERGCKLASGSYLLWPAHVGPFSLVMGVHKEHPDTSALPFSYLIEDHGNYALVPAANLKTIGTRRDADKWAKRDLRKHTNKLDQVTFSLLNPYTVGRMMKGKAILEGMLNEEPDADYFEYANMRIKRSSLQNGIRLYQLAIDSYIGNFVCEHESLLINTDANQLDEDLKGERWMDISGLIMPKSELEALVMDVETQRIVSLQDLNERFKKAAENTLNAETAWIKQLMPELKDEEERSNWKAKAKEADRILATYCVTDAEKEYADFTMIGYGLDSDGDEINDYIAVHGELEENSFVNKLREQI